MMKVSRSTARFIHVIILSAIFGGAPVLPAAENEMIREARFSSADPVSGVPAGWVLDRKSGTANIRMEKAGDTFFVRLVSDRGSSFGIKRELSVDVAAFPFLNWRWKAIRLPRGGDVRKAATDDQAVQLYVAFTATGFPAALNTPAIGYIWDNEAPRGWTGQSEQPGGGKVRYMVLRNRSDPVGEWRTESRNIRNDFRELFRDIKGTEAVTYGLQIHINSQYTNSEAEGSIGDIYFSRQDMRGLTASAHSYVAR